MDEGAVMGKMRKSVLMMGALAAACGPAGRDGIARGPGGGDTVVDASSADFSEPALQFGDGGTITQIGCIDATTCYTVYAHSDDTLYMIELASKALAPIGSFHAPMVGTGKNTFPDVITDLAVAPDNTIYVISKTVLYTADPKDGHVTAVGPVTACGNSAVALTFMPDGKLYAADYAGAFCQIDITQNPPAVKQIGSLTAGLAVAGDLVAVADGTMYATAYLLSDKTGGSTNDNLLVKIDPTTGAVSSQIGPTGFPKMFGIAFSMGEVFGFTHDGSGTVVTIDPKTGVGTLYNKFTDPSTGKGISFAGAGVNAMVAPPPIN